MKKTLCRTSLGLVLTACLLLWMSFRPAKKDRTFRPPGTVMLKTGLFMDETEVSNIYWREYLSWLKENKGEDSEVYQNALPNELVWNEFIRYSEPYMHNYFDHPAYNDYPVVGVKHQMAVDYCTWRTNRVEEMINAHPKLKKRYTPNWPVFAYRLPTKEEWESAASGVMDVSRHPKKVRKNVEELGPLVLFNVNNTERKDSIRAYITAPVRSYLPTEVGIHNLIGNVAEMLLEPGIAKGGSFTHSLEESLSDQDIVYEKESVWLGFRCVCEVSYKL